jgi:hypothetical protein
MPAMTKRERQSQRDYHGFPYGKQWKGKRTGFIKP